MKEIRCIGKEEVLKERDCRSYVASINILVIILTGPVSYQSADYSSQHSK